jgi:3-oxoacyl-[acyl-carrier-protein] synthase-3
MVQVKAGARITGTGMYVPDRIVTNDMLATMMKTDHQWIEQRTGICQRRFADDSENPATMAFNAARTALFDARLEARDIDFLLVSTLSPQHFFPGTAAFLHEALDLGTTPSMDIRAQCSGFIYGLQMARSLVVSGQYKRILFVCVELQSRGLQFNDDGRETAVLFGDGASAMVIERCDNPEQGILQVELFSEGAHAKKLWIEAPGVAHPEVITPEMIAQGKHRPSMDGRFVFKQAVQRLPECIMAVLARTGLKIEDIDHFVFHQANLRINEFVAGKMGIPSEKVHSNIMHYGNTSSASIPILIDECAKKGVIKEKDIVLSAAFGAGFNWGAAIIRW